jgi:MYXO-CTERM domain-containing protein
MTNSSLPSRPRAPLAMFASIALMVVVLLASGRALASSYAIKTPEVTEANGNWHVKVRIDLSRPPSMMHTPMRFTFSKEAVDERAIMSKGADPQHHRVVLETAAKQIVGLDVDFADPSGKVFKSTYFEFDLARKDGYFEAGEYLVTLAGPDGDVGTAQKLTLKGDNPPVYRGAMDFASDPKANKKRGPKMEAVGSGLDGGNEIAQNDTPTAAAPQSTDVVASGPAPDMVPKGSFNSTPDEEAVKDHPSGCGCVVAGTDGGSPWSHALLGGGAAALLAAALLRRR